MNNAVAGVVVLGVTGAALYFLLRKPTAPSSGDGPIGGTRPPMPPPPPPTDGRPNIPIHVGGG